MYLVLDKGERKLLETGGCYILPDLHIIWQIHLKNHKPDWFAWLERKKYKK